MKNHGMHETTDQVKGYLRKKIKRAIVEYIDQNSVHGAYFLFEDEHGESKKLYLKRLRKSVIRRNGYFINASDFFDDNGDRYTIDFFVAKRENMMYVMKALIYFYNNNKTKYFGKGMTLVRAS